MIEILPPMARLKNFLLALSIVFSVLYITSTANAQGTITGTIIDDNTRETLIGASVILKGTTTGTTTDVNGNFSLYINQNPPFSLSIGFIGYTTQEITVTNFKDKINIKLETDQVMMSEVEIVGQRISDKQKQAPLTVETMDIIAIKQAASGDFYESLGTLKGVDLTSASMGFKVINTRGFNSTSPVRSLQLIDGVDNQSPGLNFSLGNFLGAPDLDIMRVDIVAGASSAFYGPGAFNGVINMTSKNPFLFKGLNASVKVGERNLKEVGVRWADAIKNKEGVDKFAYKINFNYLTANDWEADNYEPIYDSDVPANNPGRYDAINIYGDEGFTATNNNYTDPVNVFDAPGLGKYYRSGYKESDLVDYDLENTKFNTSLHYRFQPDLEASYQFSFANGNTVYQGDNRYRLEDIKFYQNKLELVKKDKWFIRAYATHENAGKTYDIVQTGFLLNEASGADGSWNIDYSRDWKRYNFDDRVTGLPNYPTYNSGLHGSQANWIENFYNPFLAQYNDSLSLWHSQLLQMVDGSSVITDERYEPGTVRFDSLLNDIKSRDFSQGGSRFYDKSALYNIQGEYKLDYLDGVLTIGAEGRLYTPDSRGTIFRDTLQYERGIDENGEVIYLDSSYTEIKNYQYGIYIGYDRSFINNTLKANATLRMDKNENFDYLFSPAVSLVYSLSENHTFRGTVTSAVRNPTLQDQYLYYNVGRAILLGNIDGVYAQGADSLFTPESFDDYRNSPTLSEGLSKLDYFHVEAVKPEKVRTIEAGYRGTWFNKIYFDASAYYSVYTDFIGYVIGIDAQFNPQNGFPDGGIQPYRLAANATEKVITQGVSVGINYYFKKYNLHGNYSWNKLISGDEDPIIPAFNTPEHKYNIGLSAQNLRIFKLNNWGFNVNYKWIDSFIFEGSPQFTGMIDSYGLVDAQVNYTFKINKDNNCQVKLGASNLLDNQVFQVYGGPIIGRMAFFSISYDWNKNN